MSLPLTPPHTSHRSKKENRFSLSGLRVAWSAENSYHNLSSPSRIVVTASASKEPPSRSILKKRDNVQLDVPQEKQREVTPEPSDPLADLNYLQYPVSILLAEDATLRELIEGYSILAARIRSSVTGSKDADASWPLFQPLRKNAEDFTKKLVRDLGRALVDPLEGVEVLEEESTREEIIAKESLPSPKSTPSKKKRGMTADRVKYARDLCTITHSVLKLLGLMWTSIAIYDIFTTAQLREVLTAVLAIPLKEELPTPNARKTCALSIWLIQAQRLPAEVLYPARDRVAFALRRGMDGELGKEGKKGSCSDGLKAIHDLCIYQPATFVPAFVNLLQSILTNLLAPTLALRTQACHALGGFVMGCTSIRTSYFHTRISSIVASFLTHIPAIKKTASPSKTVESPIVRTLRATLSAEEPIQVAQGPVWAISVLACFVVLLGPTMATDLKITRLVTGLLSLPMRHKKSSIRSLGCIAWRTMAWAYCQPPLPLNDPDGESEVDDEVDGTDKKEKERLCKKGFWRGVESVLAYGAGISAIAAVLDDSFPEGPDEALKKVISILKAMTLRTAGGCYGDALTAMVQLVSFDSDQSPCESVIPKLLAPGLFSSNPGLLTAEFKVIANAVRPLIDQVPTFEDIRCLTKEEIAQDQVWDSFIAVWKKSLGELELQDLEAGSRDFIKIWKGLIQANVQVLQDSGDEDALSNFVIKAAEVLIELVQDPNLDFATKANNVDSVPAQDNSNSAKAHKFTNGCVKLVIIRELWRIMAKEIPSFLLMPVSERMLVCMMTNEEELVDSDGTTLAVWASVCVEILVRSEMESIKVFWGYDPADGGKPWVWSWSAETTASVWAIFVENWQKCEGHWEGAVVLLSVPFTELTCWTLSSTDTAIWEGLLEYGTSKALDYGVDSVAILNCTAAFICQNQSPTSTSTRVADLMLSHLAIADARDIPEDLIDFINDTMRSCYPPEPRNKSEALWLTTSLADVIDKTPVEFCMQMFEMLEEGLCLWLSDNHEAWSADDLGYRILGLYQNILLRISDMDIDIKKLQKLAPIIESAFRGRTDMIPLASDNFRTFWNDIISKVVCPRNGWPSGLRRCVRLSEKVVDNQTPATAIVLPQASVLPLCPTTPTTLVAVALHISSPPRPQKPSSSTETFPVHLSPTTPIRVRPRPLVQSPPVTPRSAATPRSVSASTSPTKRRRLDAEDKENDSPRITARIASVAERIALQSSPLATKSSLGKRKLNDMEKQPQEFDGPLKRNRTNLNIVLPISPACSTCIGSEDGRKIEPLVLANVSPRLPFPVTEDVFTKSPSIPTDSMTRKRKRVFMDAVVVPTFREVLQRRLRHSISLDSMAIDNCPSTVPFIHPRSISLNQCDHSLKGCKCVSDPFVSTSPRGETIKVICRSSTSRTPDRFSEMSSDDDPYIGQVTPHHLISPALHKSCLREPFDPPSDDSVPSSSPLKEAVTRRLRRTRSLQKLSFVLS
ncbi:hypothetical protein BDQ17DRAFT_1303792 [Cyathus striatus]|nr:hypothetical protein BDQ17DRAFT_1303792 [Cyathus striatus]